MMNSKSARQMAEALPNVVPEVSVVKVSGPRSVIGTEAIEIKKVSRATFLQNEFASVLSPLK